jgi:hypothetical protein
MTFAPLFSETGIPVSGASYFLVPIGMDAAFQNIHMDINHGNSYWITGFPKRFAVFLVRSLNDKQLPLLLRECCP